MLLLVDANVLIDYARTERRVLALVTASLGVLHVPRDVLDEVAELDEAACDELGIHVVDGTLEQLSEAAAGGGALSFEDRVCLILARDHGWTCVTNDRRLRVECEAHRVAVRWGLELMVELVGIGAMSSAEAVAEVEAIKLSNPRLSAAVVARFRDRVGAGPRR